MTRDIIIHDIRGRRTCTDADFPLAVGSGTQVDIRLPDSHSKATIAFVGRSESHIFIQPTDETLPVFHNNQLLTDSRWLQHGDILRMAGATLRYEAGATSISFVVEAEVVAPCVEPPEVPPPAAPPVAKSRGPGASPSPSKRRRIVTGAVLSFFLLLVVAAGFVFFATSLSVQVRPAPDSFSIDGVLPSFQVGERLLLMPGEYRVRADKAGYRPLDVAVDIGGGGDQTLEYELLRLPGVVSIVIRPEVSATVSVDDTVVGRTPLEPLELSSGEHAVMVEAPRYAPLSTTIDVVGLGEQQSIDVALSPLWAEIAIGSRPAGARVLLDDEEIGETPLRADILEGTYELTLTRSGFDAVSTTLEVIANQSQVLPEFTLVESHGLVNVETAPAGANVTVAGKYRGRTPLQLSLAPHKLHALEISKAGYEIVKRRIKVEPAGSEKLSLKLSPQYGTVFIASVPVDAQLYVDGKLHGPATGRLRLSARSHRLEIKKSGYESFTTTLVPRPGVGQEISVTLKTAAQAKAAARKAQIDTAEGQRMVLLEPQRFAMGASRREQGRRSNESQRLVEITRPYYLSVMEVTNDEFRRFKSTHSSGAIRGKSLDGPTQPVAQVTWEDSVRYLNWLSAKDSLPPAYRKAGESFVPVEPPSTGYRLPTEAEWAYGARYAGNTRALKYSWGGNYPPSGSAGNFADSAAATLLPNTVSGYGDGYIVSAPVGSFAPTARGFFDLGGNVAEWCQDYYGVYPNAAQTIVTDPAGPATGRHRVVRGSSWRHAGVSELRLSYRDYSEKARNDLGFRIARYAD